MMSGTIASRIGWAVAILGVAGGTAVAQSSYPGDPSVQPAAYYAQRPAGGYAAPSGYGANGYGVNNYGSNYRMAANPYGGSSYAAPNASYPAGGYGYRVASAQPAEVPVTAAPSAAVGPVPQNGQVYGGGYGGAGGGYATSGNVPAGDYGSGPGCQSCGTGGVGGCGGCGGCGDWGEHGLFSYFHSPCGMSQHYPYYPAMHGYYYLIPYNYPHVPQHQAFMARMGVDPRNPYSNDVFRTIYAEYRAGERTRGTAPTTPENARPSGAFPR